MNVYFSGSILVPGTYTIKTKTGSDNNSVLDTCGRPVVNTLSWVVSDRGYVTANAVPNLLCEPGYIDLTSSRTSNNPPGISNCGPASSVAPLPSSNVQVGSSLTGTAVYPFTSFWMDGRTQILFPLADLVSQGFTKGTITSIALNIAQKNSSAPFNGFTIKMGCTNLNALTGYAAIPMTTVYTPKTYNTIAGINNFNFDVPFDWDSTGGLLLEICYDNNAYTSYDYVYYTQSASNTVVYYYTDNAVGCNLTNNYAPTANRPNVRFTMVPGAKFVDKWYPGTFVQDSTMANTRAYVSSSRTFTFQIVDSNYCYRRDTANVIVSVRNPQLILPTKDTAICIGNHVQLLAAGGQSYSWTPVAFLDDPSIPNPVSTPTQTITYQVTIADQYGCTDVLSRKITVNPLPVVFAGRDTTITYGTPYQLIGNAPGGMFYLWDPILFLNNPNIPDPIATPEYGITYTLRVVDTNRCESLDSVRINISTDVPVNISSAFSPNGDGRNDVFRVNLTFQKLVEFRVFNRWGQEVFFTNDASKGWDGTYKGEPQNMDNYQYLIRVSYPGGETKAYKGNVTLIR